ncbi:MAG: (2Fe-2S) ferredoxin domain-containing protein [Clostridiales bacterium]|nr:(2Fe-2S) ferredoxin domain-containing protein [Clostridiales bacterium]
MLQVYICVGSSCHLKGSYQIVKLYEELIETNGLRGRVELKASFCLGRCTRGVSATVDDIPLENLDINNAEEIFYERIAGKVRTGTI